MFHAIAENAGTIVVTLVLVGIVAAILVKMRKDKKQGKSRQAAGMNRYGEETRFCRRYCPGVTPVCCLKKRIKEDTLGIPTSAPTIWTGSSVCDKRLQASFFRRD